ncbi:M1 family aminopeptidase [Blastococcus sp. HT6-30]|uniref:M1 family aminopeptidase n=1 Tax=Blastococcus sp. HT6-30 TaxID=3144843 RepID=UPI00321B8B11
MRTVRRWGMPLGVGLTLLVAGCTNPQPAPAPPPTPTASPTPAEPEPEPWADRPVVDLRFDVAEDLDTVAGWERVLFIPDLPTCELVFRAWPNKPATSAAGNSLVVTEVRLEDRAVGFREVAAGAPADAPAGTLVEIPLEECVEAGEAISVELEFELELGADTNERVGTSSTEEAAWFATAFPLLAWERGRGWDRGPAVPVTGEMAVSEDFVLSLAVAAPSGLEVLATGTAIGTSDGPDGTTIHRFGSPAVRDVAVSVGQFDVAERVMAGVRVQVAADEGVEAADPSDWLDQIEESMRDLIDLLGPFPYPDLSVTVLSAQTSGIEFPAAIQFGDVDPQERRGLVAHELAHMWFYGRVGNDQGEHPWLDESFATFAQMVSGGDDLPEAPVARDSAPPVGGPMSYWTEFRRPSSVYYETVYIRGGAALVAARERVGREDFDAALADYLRENAYSIATPQDVVDAFAEVPEALAVLREVGALP